MGTAVKLEDYPIISALAEQNYAAAVAALAHHFDLPDNVREELADFCHRGRYVITYGMASSFPKISRQVAVRCCGHKYYWTESVGFVAVVHDPPGASRISVMFFVP
jgi:hypothetical protein